MGEIKTKKTTGRDIRLTFKEDEQDIREYLESKSSATCFLKDLARLEMQREKRVLESASANQILEQLQQLLNQAEPKAPIFNLTANFEGVLPMTTGVPQETQNTTQKVEEDEEEFIDIDISDLV